MNYDDESTNSSQARSNEGSRNVQAGSSAMDRLDTLSNMLSRSQPNSGYPLMQQFNQLRELSDYNGLGLRNFNMNFSNLEQQLQRNVNMSMNNNYQYSFPNLTDNTSEGLFPNASNFLQYNQFPRTSGSASFKSSYQGYRQSLSDLSGVQKQDPINSSISGSLNKEGVSLSQTETGKFPNNGTTLKNKNQKKTIQRKRKQTAKSSNVNSKKQNIGDIAKNKSNTKKVRASQSQKQNNSRSSSITDDNKSDSVPCEIDGCAYASNKSFAGIDKDYGGKCFLHSKKSTILCTQEDCGGLSVYKRKCLKHAFEMKALQENTIDFVRNHWIEGGKDMKRGQIPGLIRGDFIFPGGSSYSEGASLKDYNTDICRFAEQLHRNPSLKLNRKDSKYVDTSTNIWTMSSKERVLLGDTYRYLIGKQMRQSLAERFSGVGFLAQKSSFDYMHTFSAMDFFGVFEDFMKPEDAKAAKEQLKNGSNTQMMLKLMSHTLMIRCLSKSACYAKIHSAEKDQCFAILHAPVHIIYHPQQNMAEFRATCEIVKTLPPEFQK